MNTRLTGNISATSDSISLHFVTDISNPSKVEYNEKLLSTVGIPREKLPDLIGPLEIMGTLKSGIAEDLGLPEGIAVMGGTPDLQASVVGAGVIDDSVQMLYMGTSSYISCHIPYKKTDVFHFVASTPAAIPGKYILGSEQECACACLNHFQNILNDGGEYSCAELHKLAENVEPGSGGLIFLPWLLGERTPADDSLLRGGFINMSLSTGRAQMIRSILEGVAYNSRWMMEYVERFMKKPIHTIRMIGGGAKSRTWCRIHADIMNVKIEQIEDPQLANVRGTGLLASMTLGYMTVDDLPDFVTVRETFMPDQKVRKTYDRMYREFLQSHKNLKSIFHRLNGGIARVE